MFHLSEQTEYFWKNSIKIPRLYYKELKFQALGFYEIYSVGQILKFLIMSYAIDNCESWKFGPISLCCWRNLDSTFIKSELHMIGLKAVNSNFDSFFRRWSPEFTKMKEIAEEITNKECLQNIKKKKIE